MIDDIELVSSGKHVYYSRATSIYIDTNDLMCIIIYFIIIISLTKTVQQYQIINKKGIYNLTHQRSMVQKYMITCETAGFVKTVHHQNVFRKQQQNIYLKYSCLLKCHQKE
ncbi:hypothetical protein QTP88_026463 [Uroleucon formosanum]